MTIQGVSSIMPSSGGEYTGILTNPNQRIPQTIIIPFGKIQGLPKDSFGSQTLSLMYYVHHRTNLLNNAQNYLGNIVEVTPEEYNKLPAKKRQNTQAVVIGKHGTIDEAWCAHTVSFLCEQTGINIGPHKKGVSQFIKWGQDNRIYHPIKTNTIFSMNYLSERKQREKQITEQIKNLREGDLIIWKSDTLTITQQGFTYGQASHIGIFEGINIDGTISVLEGNANEFKTGKHERLIATNKSEAKNGNQQIGEPQEVNPRDGFIRKTYTPAQLAAGGYSGYIDMQGLVR